MTESVVDFRDRFVPAHLRGYIYSLIVALQPVAIAFGVGSSDSWVLWVNLLATLLGGGLAAANTISSPRRLMYLALPAISALATFYSVLTDAQAGPIVALIATALGFGVAAAKTPVTE